MQSDPSDIAALLERHVAADEVDLALLAPPGRFAAAPLCRPQSSHCHALEWRHTKASDLENGGHTLLRHLFQSTSLV